MNSRGLNILIVEDEFLLAMNLAQVLEEQGYQIAGTAGNGPTALRLLEELQPDLVFCDINIPGPFNGIELVRKIREEGGGGLPVIFLTGRDDMETYRLARETYPAAYLTKPYSLPNLISALETAIQYASNTSQELTPPTLDNFVKNSILPVKNGVFVKQGSVFCKIRQEDLNYIAADGNHIVLYTDTRRFVLRMALSTFQAIVGFPNLIRTHRAYAVNFDKVDSFSDSELTVGGQYIPLSRQFKKSFLEQMKPH